MADGGQIATIESVYFNYPRANLVVIGPSNEHMILAAASKGYCLSFRAIDDSFHSEIANAFIRTQFFIYALQNELGGIYIPADGGLVNTLEYVTSPFAVSGTSMFQEIVGGASLEAFGKDDFEHMIWPRSWMDRHEGSSVLCSVHCIRLVHRGDMIGTLLMEEFLTSGTHPDLILTRLAKPRLTSSILVLPSWLIAETRFPDHWHTFGSTPGFTNPSTDLHSPREHRYRQDYWLVVSNKLWVPWSAGSGEELNTLDLSVTCLVKQQFSLEIFSKQYIPLFGKRHDEHYDIKLKSPFDQIERLMTAEQILMRKFFDVREIGLPGSTGGYRTFRHLKVVVNLSKYVHVSVVADHVPLLCENECKEYIVDGKLEICNTPSVVNAYISKLSYAGSSLTGDKFFNITITALGVDICGSDFFDASAAATSTFTALSSEPTKSVTVIAHSAERCFLLERMIKSIHQIYQGMKAIVTCECDLTTDSCPETPQLIANENVANTAWYTVPYDFGLSRGKQFAISQVNSEFILVLDDDFILSFNSCIECLIWRLETKLHSAAWLPLDIVGFPVLEDERAFGAFRGTLRVSDSKFFVEPFTHKSTPDGCARVDICPMVFLARTDRLKLAKWNEELPVGEHEQFFYANKHQGLQIAVCPDSSFVHLRYNGTLTENYATRRARMRELMSDTFSKVGLGQTYYFFHKYSHVDYKDFEQLASKGINPYAIPNDGGGPRDVTFGSMKLAYIGILSGIDEFSRERRMEYRLQNSLLNTSAAAGILHYVFLVVASGRGDNNLLREFDEFNDIVWIPSNHTLQLKFIAEFFRRYLFHYIMLADLLSDIEYLGTILTSLSRISRQEMAFYSSKTIMVMSRDLHAVLSDPINLKRLRDVNVNSTLFTSSHAWTDSFDVNFISL